LPERTAAAAGRRVTVIRPAPSAFDVLIDGLTSLVQSAGLLRSMTASRLKIRYRYSFLGWFWALLQPLMLMALYGVIFSSLTSYNAEPMPYALFLFSGLILWAFCSTSITTAAAGMLNYQRLMATVYFPREIVPFAFIGASLFYLAIAVSILLLMMAYYSVPIAWTALLGLPIIAIFVVLVAAVCLLLSSIQVHFRDISVALPLLLQMLMFTAPIVYPASAIPANIAGLYWLNPFAILVEDFREAVLRGAAPGAGAMLYCTFIAVFCFAISYLAFKKIERTIVDEM
jgi:lipopolysaccharide transport system permease protein